MEFGFTFWKRYDRMQVLGAQGDRPSSNGLGEPDFPSPSNEYFHTYCNADDGPMMMGASSYSSGPHAHSALPTPCTFHPTVCRRL